MKCVQDCAAVINLGAVNEIIVQIEDVELRQRSEALKPCIQNQWLSAEIAA